MTAAAAHLAKFDEAAAVALEAMYARVWAELAPPPELNILEWAETYRVLASEETATPGAYRVDNTPALRGILACASDPNVRKICTQKAAQQGYTAGVVCNVIGYHIHWRPSVIVAMFPREKSSKDFAAEKFEPMVRATPELAKRVNLKSRAAGNGSTRRSFTGGLLKLVASNSPSDVKSSSGRIGIVEEPDDANKDVGGQGNSIALLAERTKTYAPNDLQLIGGTPTAKATSLIVKEMRGTDQRYFMVQCHSCGERHTLDWSNVTIPGLKLSEEDLALTPEALAAKWPLREVYGHARWEDAYYTCPPCGTVWTDEDRIDNIKRTALVPPLFGWVPTAESTTPGFFLNELLSTFDGSRLPLLAQKYLVAKAEFDNGEPEKMVAFWNSTLGLPWEYRGELPEEDELRQRAEDYQEWSCPTGGLVPLLNVDVQHDRLAVTCWVLGRGEEMWLAFWGEFPGRTNVSHQGAWRELEALLTRTVHHASGVELPIAAVGIDSGDGQTTDAVYDFVRKHNSRMRPVIATKGASDSVGRVEIWTRPKNIDPNRRSTKASRVGLQVHIVGTAKAKDALIGSSQEGGRVRLLGNGPGRMHWYKTVRPDFFEQLLGEMKIPRRAGGVREWTERTDRRNEALDCTTGALHLSCHLRLHLRKPHEWQVVEARSRQAVLPMGDDMQDEEALQAPEEAAATATIKQEEAPPAAPPPPAAPTPPPPRVVVHTSAPGLASPEWSSRL